MRVVVRQGFYCTVFCRSVGLGPVVQADLNGAWAWSDLAVGSEAHIFVLFFVNT